MLPSERSIFPCTSVQFFFSVFMKWAVFSKVKLDQLSVCEGRHSMGFLVGQFGNSFSFMGNNKKKSMVMHNRQCFFSQFLWT
jgi:hypothetical protein